MDAVLPWQDFGAEPGVQSLQPGDGDRRWAHDEQGPLHIVAGRHTDCLRRHIMQSSAQTSCCFDIRASHDVDKQWAASNHGLLSLKAC